jgi:hypothetical protein
LEHSREILYVVLQQRLEATLAPKLPSFELLLATLIIQYSHSQVNQVEAVVASTNCKLCGLLVDL